MSFGNYANLAALPLYIMIFEEIINNEYKIISHNIQLDKLDRENIKFFLTNRKKLQIEKDIYLYVKNNKLGEIEKQINIINENIKKIKDKYDNIFIEEI